MISEIIIPQAALKDAKRRLAGYVDRQQRVRLARELLIRTVTLAKTVAPVSVVSPSPALAQLVDDLGGRFILQTSRGLNGGVCNARDNALRRRVGVVAVVHADLPLLQGADLQILLESAEENGIAIAPDKTGSGSNALALATKTPFVFRFGADSFLAHRCEAMKRELRVSVVRRLGLSLDLDTPGDLEALVALNRLQWLRSVLRVDAAPDDQAFSRA